VVRRRLDHELVRRGLAESGAQARSLVEAGAVLVSGAPADKPGRLVGEGEPVVVVSPPPFVSRGGEKLDAALDAFAVAVDGRRALDAGASTGGFTDCLLQRGARTVVAVDVGHGQLHPRLRHDPRVSVVERTNVRSLRAPSVGGPFDVVSADLSFISVAAVAPVLAGELSRPGADVVVLVKPQFEAGREAVRRGRGVVRDPAVRRAALESAASALARAGATIMGAMASPILGPAGNAEFFLHARAHGSGGPGPSELAAMLDAALSCAPDAGPARPAPAEPASGDVSG
jgi:23S rRNA (cytidine1920-2'-O)/16S rRNA (cytidine1409-2'-O)-methyltransferase